ncbi:MAG: trigger factor [Chloroflexi bacterium]|nr:trigger factor [Chloroflexota bacterium]
MKVTKDKTENSQVFLTIEMEPVEVEDSLEEAYHRLVKKTNVPGFRKGKAPRVMLERQIGKEGLLEDALNTLIPKAYENAVKEQEIEAFARPSIEIAQTDPLVFKATVPLPPRVELGDYRSIQMTPEPVELSEDSVSSVIEELRHQQATWEPVECAVGSNDIVILDVESTVDDKPFINQNGAQYRVLENQPLPVPGFAEQLLGMRRDEEKEFRLQIPLDYSKSELAGKETLFRVKVSEVKQESLPELNDEFAKGITPNFETLDALREQVSTDLRLRAEEKTKLDLEERVIDAVVDLAEIEFPPFLVDMEINRLLEQQLRYWQGGGRGLEEYLASVNKTRGELQEELRPLATKRVIRSLVLGKVSDEEKIEVSGPEIDAEIEDMIKGAAEDKKDEFKASLNAPQFRESIGTLLVRRKTVQRLIEIAKGSNIGVETSQKEEGK